MEESVKKQPTPAFLEKLFDILEDNRSYSHLIAWQPDGNSFIIKKVNEFSEVVLPRYFKHSNIQSYIRQLNMYGFSKTRHDSNHHEFTHKLFQRGRRDLLPLIRRKTQQNPGVKSATGGTTALDSSANNKSVFLLSNQTNVSSEASQSSNGADEDNGEFESSVIMNMQSRIISLEEQVDQLSKICNDLLSQHNYLCEALNKCNRGSITTGNNNNKSNFSDLCSNSAEKANHQSSSSDLKNSNTPSVAGSDDANSSSSPATGTFKRRLDEEETASDGKVDEEMVRGSPLKRIRSVIDTSTLISIGEIGIKSGHDRIGSISNTGDNGNNNSTDSSIKGGEDDERRLTLYAVKTERGGSISSHTDATTASSVSSFVSSRHNHTNSNMVDIDFLDFKVQKSQLPSFISDVYKIAIVSNHTVGTNSSKSAQQAARTQQQLQQQHHIYSHGDPDFALLLAKAGGQFDLGGLEAITNAATILDHGEDARSTSHQDTRSMHLNTSLVDESAFRVKYPLFTASALAATQFHGARPKHPVASEHQQPQSQSDVITSTATMAQETSGLGSEEEVHANLLAARAGGPLMKAYSIGP